MFCAWHCWLVTANRHSWRPKSLPWARDRGNNMCCVSQTHPQPPVVAGGARGLGQTGCPLISTRTRGEMPRRPDVLACARERKAAGRGGSVERTQGAGARSASATPLWAEGVGFGSSARCGSSCPPVVPSRQTTWSAHRAQDISRAAPQANRVTAGAEAPRGVWAHTAPRPPIRAELWGASFGEHRLRAALL